MNNYCTLPLTPEDFAISLRVCRTPDGRRFRVLASHDHSHALAELATGKRASMRARWRIANATHGLRTAIY